jgi:PAS domain S-box-containing protein
MQDQNKMDYHLAKQELEDAPHSQRQIASVAQGMIFQLADGSPPVCNGMAETILGVTAEEIKGWNAPNGAWGLVDKNGTPLTENTHPAMVSLATGKPCWNVVVGLYQVNNDFKWLLMNSQPLFLVEQIGPYAVVYTFTEINQPESELICDNSGVKERGTENMLLKPQLQISETKAEAENIKELTENDSKFKKLVDANIIGIVFADFDKIIEANDIFLEMVGYTREDLLTGIISWRQITPPEYQYLDEKALQELLEFGSFTAFEKEYIRKDGSRVPILLGGAIWQDSPLNCICFAMDLSERQQMQKSLENVWQRLNFHVDNSPLAIIEWDDEFRVSRWSREAEKIFGWKAEEVMGKKYDDWQFGFAEDQEIIEDVIQRLCNGSATQVISQNRNYTKQGSVVYCEWYNSALLDEAGNLISVLSQVLNVTESKQIEAALRESEARFRYMADNSPSLIWMSDVTNLCCYFNKSWLEFTGRTLEEEIGDGWLQGVHPEDLQRCFTTYINAFNAREQFKMEYRLRRYDGEYTWILDIGVPRFTSEGNFLGYIGSCIDISDRKQVEVEREIMLARSQEYTRQLNGLMEAALAINSALSIEDIIRIITEQSREIIGSHQSVTSITRDEDSGKLMSWASMSEKYAGFPVPHQHPDWFSIHTRLRQTNRAMRMNAGEIAEDPQGETLNPEIDKDEFMGWLAAPLIGRDGHNLGVIQLSDKYEGDFTTEDEAIIVQLAQMASIAIEKTKLYKAEQQARAQAEESNCIKDEFLAVLSHELRSPLNPILGWSKLLQTRKFSAEKTATALATIERNARLQAQLIEDLLDVSRILQGKLRLNVAQVNLVSTITAAMETVRLAAEAKSIDLQFLPPTDTAIMVMGDPNRLQQVFWNLLSNAVKFTPPAGRVDVCLAIIGADIQIQVKDTGKGIAPQFLAYVFDYFRQADSATTRKFGGLGLGLAIVRQLVELHGGRVFADSAGEGQGATFTVQLPTLPTELMTPSTHGEGKMDSNLGNLEGIKILVVDDDLDSRDFICFVLVEEGAEVISVSSASEALQALPESKPDVLLSDIGMPEMDGYMLMREVRSWSSEQGGKTPAIALTAYAGEYNQQQALSAGFQMHVTKPAEPAELVAAVARLAGKKVISH